MIFDEIIAKEIAEILVKINAIMVKNNNYFTWSSGWKSPIYCDNRISLSFPKERSYIIDQFVKLIDAKFPEANAFVGVATAGIPHGALVADRKSKPFAYVRSKSKEHGMQNKIEGRIEKDAKIVVIEDLISTGKSTINVIETLKNENLNVIGATAIFDYGFDFAVKNFDKVNDPFYTLSNYESLIKNMELSSADKDELLKWNADPENWKKD